MDLLLAIDAESADDTFACARSWLGPLGGRLDLLFVAVPPEVPGASPELQAALDAGARKNEAEVRRRLEELLATCPEAQRGEVLVTRGHHVAEEIVRQVEGYDLLLVGTHGRQGLLRLWLGSVAERVVRTSPIPVLVLRGEAPVGQPVLAAVDLTRSPAAFLAEAARWAVRLGSHVDAVHVTAPPMPVDAMGTGAGWALGWVEASRAAEHRLAELVAALPDPVRGTGRVDRGDAAAVLAERSAGYGLVVVGTHQRQGALRFWLGSVAEAVARRAASAVLVYPQPD